MRSLKILGVVMMLALAGLAISPAAKAAGTFNEKVMVTFNQPVELPGGKVLAAGKYMMTVLDHNAYRHIVQFFNEDRSHLYATVLAIPNYRLTPTDQIVITFAERPAGSPQAVKAWFYPGEKFGHEFVYPKARAVELAKLTNEPIPAIASELSSDLTQPTAPQTARLESAPITAEQPSGEEVPVVEAFPSQTLPHTGSTIPLIGLIGLLSLVAAFGLRSYARQGA
jgi:hypothetical protein